MAFEIKEDVLIKYIPEKGVTNVFIPENIKEIGSEAFAKCHNIKNVTIAGKGRAIHASAFKGCKSLESVTFLKYFTSICKDAFRDCISLKSITIPDGTDIINEQAFYNCTSLTDVIRSEDTHIDYSAFDNTPWLKKIQFLTRYDTLIRVDENVEGDIKIPDGITIIKSHAFYNCRKITGITLPESLQTISDNGMNNCAKLTSIKIPESVDFIGAYAFTDCFHLTEITLPSGITEIKDGTFKGCVRLTEIKIPDGVKSIGYAAFSDCAELKKVTLPESLESIGMWAFSNCIRLSDMELPENLKSIGENAFSGSYWFDNLISQKKIIIINNIFIRASAELSGEIVIPDGVTVISNKAFSECKNITKIRIPDSVKTIGKHAFERCSGLQRITIPDSVENIEEYAFEYCKSLVAVKLAHGIKKITWGLFYCCRRLEYIEIPDSVTEIATDAFRDCTSLERITIPESVTRINGYAFIGCKKLEDIEIPESIDFIGYNAFEQTPWLENRFRENPYLIINGILVAVNPDIDKITIPDNVTAVAPLAFVKGKSPKGLIIPDSVKTAHTDAFNNCISIILVHENVSIEVMLPDNIKYVDRHKRYNDTFYKFAVEKNPAKREEIFRNIEKSELKIPAAVFLLLAYDSKEGRKYVYNNIYGALKYCIDIDNPEITTRLLGLRFIILKEEVDELIQYANENKRYEIQIILNEYRQNNFSSDSDDFDKYFI